MLALSCRRALVASILGLLLALTGSCGNRAGPPVDDGRSADAGIGDGPGPFDGGSPDGTSADAGAGDTGDADPDAGVDAGDAADAGDETGGGDGGPGDLTGDAPFDGGTDASPDVAADLPPTGCEADLGGGPYPGLCDSALREALLADITDHTSLGYDVARQKLLYADGIEVQDGLLECYYTGARVAPDGTFTPNGFNTEHTQPQSQGASAEPARSDLHHLFPVIESANNARSNFPFGDSDCDQTSSCSFSLGGSERGPSNVDGSTIFEVRPVRRGDIARAIFYFSVRYERPIAAVQEGALRVWHREDPPDDLERTRNDRIFGLQNNRNPFVDAPELVDRISDF